MPRANANPTLEPQTLSLKELYELLGLTMTQGYDLAARDALPIPVLRCGRLYRFSRRALDEVLQRQHDDTAA